MRDATGSAWIFSICLTFIILFTAYLAISVNYAKAFRIKNHIISEIEENEGYNDSLEQDLEEYLISQGYDAHGVCDPYVDIEGKDENWALEKCIGDDDVPAGQCSICLYRRVADHQKNPIIRDDGAVNRSYYRVVAFFKFDLPVVKTFLPAFQVAGESRYIYDFANS